MVTLIGAWEKGWLDAKTEHFMWKQLKHAYAVDSLVMVGQSGESRILTEQYDTLDEALETTQGEVVLLEPLGNLALKNFKPPADVVYVFNNAMNKNLARPETKVRIETPNPTDLFAINAAAIVLAHHYEHR